MVVRPTKVGYVNDEISALTTPIVVQKEISDVVISLAPSVRLFLRQVLYRSRRASVKGKKKNIRKTLIHETLNHLQIPRGPNDLTSQSLISGLLQQFQQLLPGIKKP